MKLLFTSVLAATLATSAIAGNSKSDRYNDLRFNSAIGHFDNFAAAPQGTFKSNKSFKRVTTKPRFSTRSNRGTHSLGAPRLRTHGKRFPYGGYGQGNDSR